MNIKALFSLVLITVFSFQALATEKKKEKEKTLITCSKEGVAGGSVYKVKQNGEKMSLIRFNAGVAPMHRKVTKIDITGAQLNIPKCMCKSFFLSLDRGKDGYLSISQGKEKASIDISLKSPNDKLNTGKILTEYTCSRQSSLGHD